MSDHPYLKIPRPTISTTSMEDGLTKIAAAIEAEYHGAGLHSLTRFGKTRLGMYITENWEWLGRKYYAFITSVPQDPKVGSAAFYEYVFNGLRISLPSHFTPMQKLGRVVNTLITRANALGTTLIIFVLDEANRLPGQDFDHLGTIDNELALRGYTFFAVTLFQDNYTSSGRPEKINALEVTPQIRARFLTRFHPMHGIRDPDDMRVFMHRLEDETEHPPGSGISYPRHLAPELYERGFRMAPSAPMLWERGRIAVAGAGRSDLNEWPMKPFELAVFYLVTRIIVRQGFNAFTNEDIDEAIAFCDLINFNGLSGTVEDI